MKYIIGGGTGFIGQQLCRHLKKRGHEAIVISRKPDKGKLTWDFLKNSLELPPCDGLVNLAGENILNPMRRWDVAYKEDVRNSRIGTNEILISCLKNMKSVPPVFISTSAIGYYPPSTTVSYDESFILKPSNFMEKLVLDWEKSATVPTDLSSNMRHVVIRVGLVLGRTGGIIQNSIWPFWLGLGGRFGSGNQHFPWVHIDDAVGIYTHALENESVDGVLNAVSPGLSDNSTFTKELAAALHRPAIFPVPRFVLDIVFSPERAELLTTGQKVVGKRTIESGYSFLFPDLKDALRNIVKS